MDDELLLEHARSVTLADYGVAGLTSMREASVCLVGLGGIGGLVAELLVRNALGRLDCWDHDRVEASNLPRQLLFARADLGLTKAEAAVAHLGNLGPTSCQAHSESWHFGAPAADLVLVATDDLASRYQVARWALAHQTPFVSGAVLARDGQVFVSQSAGDACYACLFPASEDPAQEEDSCVELGVYAPLAASVAALCAMLAIDRLTDPQPASWGTALRLLDGRAATQKAIRVPRAPGCRICAPATDREDR